MDIQLYFEEKGSGTPFIFLHGNGEDGTYFKNQTDFFKESIASSPSTQGGTENLRAAKNRLQSNNSLAIYTIL